MDRISRNVIRPLLAIVGLILGSMHAVCHLLTQPASQPATGTEYDGLYACGYMPLIPPQREMI